MPFTGSVELTFTSHFPPAIRLKPPVMITRLQFGQMIIASMSLPPFVVASTTIPLVTVVSSVLSFLCRSAWCGNAYGGAWLYTSAFSTSNESLNYTGSISSVPLSTYNLYAVPVVLSIKIRPFELSVILTSVVKNA